MMQAAALPVSKSLSAPKTVSILGATGSVGQSTVDLLRQNPEKFQVEALTAQNNVKLLAEQARLLKAKKAVIGNRDLYQELKSALAGTDIEAAAGRDAIIDAASQPVDWVMSAIVGTAGLAPTMAAIRHGRTVALANKESLVCAGRLMMDAVSHHGGKLLPVDSEHNAVFQVLDPARKSDITKIILTASGGPFRTRSRAELENITPAEAVRHPTWSMGAKISIDSATLMNKALEIIEAHYLFDMPSEKLDAVLHPQSIVHAMVEYCDGSVLTQMAAADMRTPIAHTLAYPERMPTGGKSLNLAQNMNLSFEPIDKERFISMKLLRDVLRAGASAPLVFNAANEVAVAAFMAGRIKFLEIESVVADTLQKSSFAPISSLDAIEDADISARALAAAQIRA